MRVVWPLSRPGPSNPFQKFSLPTPAGATTPRPVTATLRPPLIRPWRRLDALELFFGHDDSELLLECHDEFDEVEAVGIEIVAELGVGLHGIWLHREHLDGAFLKSGEQFLIHGFLHVEWVCLS